MKTIRPNLNKKSAFDALLETRFTFTFSGNQVLKNELIIRNNVTNEIFYQETITSFQLFHLLPANTLQNGISYNAELRVYDSSDDTSAWSNTIVFMCLKTPIFGFSNLTPNQIIGNPSYEFTLEYSQENGEPLNSTIVSLYYNGVEKFNTGHKHGDKLLSTTINALEDNSQYKIRATGETLNGLVIDTGLVSFSVEYIEPSLFAIVDLENICPTGEIRIQSNIKSIIGISNPSPPSYDNSKVLLTESGSWVEFDEGFSIANDFTLQVKCNALNKYSTILTMSNMDNKIELIYMHGTFEQVDCAYFILKAFNSITSYYQTSNYIDIPDDADELLVTIHQAKYTYQVLVENQGKEV